jgi:hypothetical protein
LPSLGFRLSENDKKFARPSRGPTRYELEQIYRDVKSIVLSMVFLTMNKIEYKKNLVKLHELLDLHGSDNVGVPDFIASAFFGPGNAGISILPSPENCTKQHGKRQNFKPASQHSHNVGEFDHPA